MVFHPIPTEHDHRLARQLRDLRVTQWSKRTNGKRHLTLEFKVRASSYGRVTREQNLTALVNAVHEHASAYQRAMLMEDHIHLEPGAVVPNQPHAFYQMSAVSTKGSDALASLHEALKTLHHGTPLVRGAGKITTHVQNALKYAKRAWKDKRP